MRKQRLLFVVNDFPPMLGGESTLYSALARHLPQNELILLAPRQPGDAAIDAELGCEVIRMRIPPHRGILARIARSVVAAVRIAQLLLVKRVGTILCGQLLSLGAPTRVLAGIARIPYAVFVHGADLLDYDYPPWGGLSRWVLSGASTIVVNSRFTAGLVSRHIPSAAARIFILPMGVEPPAPVDPEEVESLRHRYRLGGGPILVSLARLVPIKGHDTVIRALPQLIARFPDLSYLIVGEGPERKDLEDLARSLSVTDHVHFAGAVPQEEVPAHYRLATLYVQVSRNPDHRGGVEGYGLSFLEAASHGLPSIAGSSGGVPEAVDDGRSGVLVPPGDPAALAQSVRNLLDDPARLASMSEGATRHARLHTWQRSARALMQWLDRAPGRPTARRTSAAGARSVPGAFEEGGHRP